MKNYLKTFSDKDITFMLYGLFLGDGSYRNGLLRIRHTNKQRFYILWLKNICELLKLNYKVKFDFEMKTNFGDFVYSEILIKVPTKFYFESLNKCFDANNKKIVSEYVLKNINLLGILLWFLDDGSLIVSKKNNKTKRFAYLNTQSFTYEENILIQRMFKDRFNIETRIHIDHSGIYKDRRYFRIYMNAKNFQKFFDLLRDLLSFIPNEFYYKFNMQYEINRLHNSVYNMKMYNLISN